MQAILYDTSVYIHAMRRGDVSVLQTRNVLHASPLWLSAVVLEELYAGATDAAVRKMLNKTEHDFVKANRLLVPTLGDWTKTGHLLANIGAKYGFEMIGRARLTNDALIATSTARMGLLLLTRNSRDFARMEKFCAVRWQSI
jgi:predicted nucleic acid-binding protein